MKRPYLSKPRLISYIIAIIILFSLIFFRLYQLQIQETSKWKDFGKNEYKRSMRIIKKRGDIFDCNLNQLATSVPVYSIFVDPKSTFNRNERWFSSISSIIGINKDSLKKKINKYKKYRFLWIKRRLSDIEYKKLKALSLSGVHFKREFARKYPEKTLASQVLGFVGNDDNDLLDNKGLEGLEYRFDDIISGKFVYLPQDQNDTLFKNAESASLVLTIDSVIQHICEEELANTCKEYDAKSGELVVIEPSTGKILAMANFPFFDINNRRGKNISSFKNRVVTDRFEPGSTMKLITMSAALEEHAIKLDEEFNCTGSIPVDSGPPIKCDAVHGLIKPDKIIAYSCNVGIIQVAFKLGAKKLYSYLDKFGFLDNVGINFPGETSSQVKFWRSWYPRDLASIAFGQGIAVTGLHIAQAVSAIANKGILMAPYLVEKIIDPSGAVITEYKPHIKNKVISPKTAKEIMSMCKEVVQFGTGRHAKIKGYEVAGKTGTAQKAEAGAGYSDSKYISSFVGIIPADSPKAVIFINIDEPNTDKAYGGGSVAGPLFRRIAEKVMRYMGIFPAGETSSPIKKNLNSNKNNTVPDLVGKNIKEIGLIKKNAKFSIKVRGEGSVVIFQLPKAGIPLANTTSINLYMGERKLYDKLYNKGKNIMPNLYGRTLKDVVNLLKAFKNPVTIRGHGVVIEQSPKPGTKIDITTSIIIRLSSSNGGESNETIENTKEIYTNKDN